MSDFLWGAALGFGSGGFGTAFAVTWLWMRDRARYVDRWED